MTPRVAAELLKEWKANGAPTWDFWELASGSGRLSFIAETEFQLPIGFPVDYRYGWDLDYKPTATF